MDKEVKGRRGQEQRREKTTGTSSSETEVLDIMTGHVEKDFAFRGQRS